MLGGGKFAVMRSRRQEKQKPAEAGFWRDGSPGWIRTTECLSQSQVPYRLATGLFSCASCAVKAALHGRTFPKSSKPGVLPRFALQTVAAKPRHVCVVSPPADVGTSSAEYR